MKVLVTGAAGFIGFHLSKSLLQSGLEVCGIDNINDYYDINLKNDRINILNNFDSFSFNKIDIADYAELKSVFKVFEPELVVNLAAQAGVRYSIENPSVYVNSNLVGFSNIIEISKCYKVNGFIYASSSSVYGANKKTPFSVNDRVEQPISLYAATKRSNELIAYSYSHLFELNTTGLRFFTVYGPWGRPDMAMYIFADKISSGLPIQIYNNGLMKRDFTYIDDIVSGIISTMKKNYKCEIFNLGNNRSENILDVVSYIEKNLDKKASIEFLPMQPGDVKEAHADIEKSVKMLNFNPSVNVDKGIESFLKWYKSYK